MNDRQKNNRQESDEQKKEQSSAARDQVIRAALDQHWTASDANDFETEHLIYQEDAVLEYPQSGERFRADDELVISEEQTRFRKGEQQ